MSNRERWLSDVRPLAQEAASRVNLHASTVLAQWAHETGFGSSNLARNHNNLAGLKHVGSSVAGAYRADSAGHAGYPDRDTFLEDYVRVMSLGFYERVRDALTPQGEIDALDDSPYAEDPDYGEKLQRIWESYTVPADGEPEQGPDRRVSVRPAPDSPERVQVSMTGIGAATAAGLLLLALVQVVGGSE